MVVSGVYGVTTYGNCVYGSLGDFITAPIIIDVANEYYKPVLVKTDNSLNAPQLLKND